MGHIDATEILILILPQRQKDLHNSHDIMVKNSTICSHIITDTITTNEKFSTE